MIRPIVKDVFFLGQKSTEATKEDGFIAKDLRDTLEVKRAECVGMAANMIGFKKRIIIVDFGIGSVVMNNPVIVKKSGPYETEEGCLSLEGERKTTRYQEIEVEYQDSTFRKKKMKLNGYTAQIVQHECDHLDGIII